MNKHWMDNVRIPLYLLPIRSMREQPHLLCVQLDVIPVMVEECRTQLRMLRYYRQRPQGLLSTGAVHPLRPRCVI